MRIPKRLLPALLGAALLVVVGCAPKAAVSPTPTAWVMATPLATAAAPADTAAAAQSGALSADEAKISAFTAKLVNQPATDFTLKDLDGKQWKLSDLKGKVVLLNFWATWCGPCQGEMPGFQNLQNLNRDDVQILAVASAATEGQDAKASLDTVTQFIRQQKYTFPVLFDADGSAWNIYQQSGIPANYILDRQGKVRLLQVGAFASEDDMMAALEAVRRLDGE